MGRANAHFVVVFNRIPEVAAEVEVRARATVARAAEQAAADAKQRAPVATGFLRDSISAQVDGKDADVIAAAEYAAYVEYGTYKAAAKPFFTSAVEGSKSILFSPSNYFPRSAL